MSTRSTVGKTKKNCTQRSSFPPSSRRRHTTTTFCPCKFITRAASLGSELGQRPAGPVRPDVRAAGAGDVQRPESVVGDGVVAQGAASPARMAPRLRSAPAGGGGESGFDLPFFPPLL